jgi:hypothetical protein
VAESALSHMHVARHGFFGMIAHTLGLGVPIGLALSVGEQALKRGAKARVFGDAVKTIEGQSNTSMALDAVKVLDGRLASSAKELFSTLATGKVAAHAVDTSIGRFLPTGGVGLSRAQQVQQLRTAVNQHQDNPGGVAEHLGQLTAPLHQEGLGQVADAYTQHQLRLMKVIQAVLPQDPKMNQPHPFTRNVAEDEISPAVKARYERAMTVAGDPTALLGLVKSNTITQADVAIAAATNPSTLQKMRAALVDEALKSKPDLSYQQRLSMGILMGENIDQSTAQLPVLQGAFAVPPAAGSTGIPSAKPKSEKSGAEIAEAFLPDSAKGIVSSRGPEP